MRNKIVAAKQTVWNNRWGIAVVGTTITVCGLYAVGAYCDLQTARTQLEIVHIENAPIIEI